MNKWEIRSYKAEDAEVRVIPESREIVGYGVVFNSWSDDLGGFREIILPSAVSGVLERSDIFCLMNHSFEKGVLARNTKGQGSLNISTDEHGVKYAFTAPRYNLGDELLEGVTRGDIRGSSFAFTIAKGGDKYEKADDGIWERTIFQLDKIYDLSPVYNPAYSETSVAKRSISELEAIEKPMSIDTKPVVVEEAATEPIVEYQRKVVSDIELQYRQYIQERQINE